MSRSVNYNVLKYNNYLEIIDDDSIQQIIPIKNDHKIKKSKKFDDGTPIKSTRKKIKHLNKI